MQIIFIQYRQLSYGESLYLIGNIPELGQWDPIKSVKLNYYDQHIWKITLNVPNDQKIEYKYFIAQTDSLNEIKWDYGENRILDGRLQSLQKIMTFNIRYDNLDDGQNSWIHRKNQVLNLIQKINPHIIGFQEVYHHQNQDLIQLPNYNQIWRGRQKQFYEDEGSPLYYDMTNFDYIKSDVFWLSDTPNIPGSKTYGNGFPRICTYVQLQNKVTKKIYNIYNTHFDHEHKESQKKSAHQIKKHIKENFLPDECIIVMGDLNSLPLSDPVKILEQEGLQLINTISITDIPLATYHDWRGFKLGIHIDYVFLYNLKFEKMNIIRDKTDRYPSDHFPKVVDYL